MKSLVIESGYRVHINSVDLNGNRGRCCGGLGIALAEPLLKLRVEIGGRVGVDTPHEEELREYLARLLTIEGLKGPVFVQQISGVRPHIGLGSLTQLKLAILAAIRIAKGKGVAESSIPKGLGIAATSGIGLGTFLYGGFVADGGYRVTGKAPKTINGELDGNPPPIIFHCDLPQEWRVVLAIPVTGTGISGAREKNFFDEITPIPEDEVNLLSREVLLSVMPAVKERDIESLCLALQKVCSLGSKPFEERLDSRTAAVLDSMRARFGFASVSSLGPTCYSLTVAASGLAGEVSCLATEHPDYVWTASQIRNAPFGVQLEPT